MTSRVLLFLLGAIVGAGICAAVLSHHTKTESAATGAASNAAFSNQLAEFQATISDAKTRLASAREENDKLVARVQELMQQQEAAQAAKPKPAKKTGIAALFGGEEGTNGFSEAMSGIMKSAIQQQIEGKLGGMKTKLNLTPEQEKAIREVMEKQMNRGTELAQKMFKGDVTKEEMESMGKDQVSEKDQIKALLTPEQVAQYDDYEKEEAVRMSRLVANSELLQMQSSLQLTQEQQDQVYAVLAEQAQLQMSGGNTGTGSDAMDFRKQAEKKAEALSKVLTPEQLERYKQQQEQQIKMIETFLPKSGTNANADVHLQVVPQ